MCRPEFRCAVAFEGNGINADDVLRTNRSRALQRVHADPASPDYDNGVAGFGSRGGCGRTPAGGYPAGHQCGCVQGNSSASLMSACSAVTMYSAKVPS